MHGVCEVIIELYRNLQLVDKLKLVLAYGGHKGYTIQ